MEIAYVGATILDVCKRVRKKTLVGGNHQSKIFHFAYLLQKIVFFFILVHHRVFVFPLKVALEVIQRGK